MSLLPQIAPQVNLFSPEQEPRLRGALECSTCAGQGFTAEADDELVPCPDCSGRGNFPFELPLRNPLTSTLVALTLQQSMDRHALEAQRLANEREAAQSPRGGCCNDWPFCSHAVALAEKGGAA
jgi:hypothetical protein